MFEPNYKKLVFTIGTVVVIVLAAVFLWFAIPQYEQVNATASEEEITAPADDYIVEESTEPEEIIEEPVPTETYTGIHSRVDYATALVMQDEYNLVENDSISLYMAQNEKEGIEYIISVDSKFNNLSFEVSPATDANGNVLDSEMFLAGYTEVKRTMYAWKGVEKNKLGYYPDALWPYSGSSFVLEPHKSQTMYVRFETDFETVPGVYSGTISLLSNGNPIDTCSYEINVWDLAYSEKTACQTAFDNWWNPEVVPVPGDMETFTKYYEYLLDNRICGYYLPFEAYEYDTIKPYLDNDRVTSFRVYSLTDIKREWLTSNEEWLKKAYYYPVDEPLDAEGLERVRSAYLEKQSVLPEISMVTPFPAQIKASSGQDICDYMNNFTNLFCPNADLFRGDYLQKIQKLKDDPDNTLWWYVCGGQSIDSIDLLASTPGIDKRILFWQQYQNNVDGLLYWGTCYWEGFSFENSPTTDGVLLYYDPETYDPIGTLGLEAVRDGIEDYQLLHMSEEILGKEETTPFVEAITTSITEWNGNSRELMRQRNAIVDAIISHRE